MKIKATQLKDAHGRTFPFPTEPGAPNLDDGYTQEELMTFWAITASSYGRPIIVARQLFPGRPRGYVRATLDLARYASNKATAMGCRRRGEISAALVCENICDRIYSRYLPAFARW